MLYSIYFTNRSFYLCKRVEEYAKWNPEEREESEEIVQEFKDLPVQLLDQCSGTKEAQLILEDQTGASKFFRDPKNMLLPKLHLAIEHNYKCFVAHPMSQQVFQHSFHKGMPWHGKPLHLQIFHSILQVVLAPFLVIMWVFVWIGKNVSEIRGIDKDELSLYGIKKWNSSNPSMARKCFNKIIDYTNKKQLKLDVPLNRLIIFTGYYILFVVSLLYVVWDKILDGNSYCFGKSWVILTMFAIPMVWQDFSTLWNVRSFWTFFKFWRMYDLTLHIALALTLIFRSAKVLTSESIDYCTGCTLVECHNGTINETMPSNSTSTGIAVVEALDDWEDGLLSFVSTFSVCR